MSICKWLTFVSIIVSPIASAQESDNPWYIEAQQLIKERASSKPIENKAKNIILFIADGNGVTSNTAIRIYSGQKKGEKGEAYALSYEKFPYAGLIKTYNTNAQTPDSAGTATAMMSGVKTKQGVLGVDEYLERKACDNTPNHIVKSLAATLEEKGKDVGIVSTARVTHATPAAVYAHSADRDYEAAIPDGCKGQKDIASQLVEWPFGDGLDVVMGGGRRSFLPSHMEDEDGKKGKRGDNLNLIEAWQAKGENYKYINSKNELEAWDSQSNDKILALFNASHMEYEKDRINGNEKEPSLAEMTKKAIERLDNNEKGYFLMVEAGRVDHGHHAGNAARALEDGAAFDEAIRLADEMTNDEETLIIVTADHSHTMTFSGYQPLNNPILGLVRKINGDGSPSDELALALDGKPYTTLSYMNGPGSVIASDAQEEASIKNMRKDLTEEDVEDEDFLQQSLIPLSSETHGGGDVAIYAKGPWAHLINGVSEQNIIYHVMKYAAEAQ